MMARRRRCSLAWVFAWALALACGHPAQQGTGSGEAGTSATLLAAAPAGAPVAGDEPKAGETFGVDLGASLTLQMVWVPSGRFTMGSPPCEKGQYGDELPQTEVSVEGFWMGKYEVTVGEFLRFAEDTDYRTEAEATSGVLTATKDGTWHIGRSMRTWRNPGYAQTERHPVALATWNDASAFCTWLSRKTGREFRLPTEAEWEYACRAGTRTAYQWGGDPAGGAGWANVADETGKKADPAFSEWEVFPFNDGYGFASPVGSFRANAFGLYDMHGNVWEWTRSLYKPYPYDDTDGRNAGYSTGRDAQPAGDEPRVLRGGSWCSNPPVCRSANRSTSYPPSTKDRRIGFRVTAAPVRDADTVTSTSTSTSWNTSLPAKENGS